MVYENAQYANQEEQMINVVENGAALTVPVCLGNRHYQEILRQVSEEGLVIAEYSE